MSTGISGGRGGAARWAGGVLVVVAAGIGFLTFASGTWGPAGTDDLRAVTALRACVAALFLVAGLLALAAGRLLGTAEETTRVLSASLAGLGDAGAPGKDPLTAARSVARRLDRCREEKAAAAAEAARQQETRVAELTEAHRDLLAHHKFTKKMLRSPRTEDVFETLLQGVRDGLGFPGTVLGTKNDKGDIVFNRGIGPDGAETVRVACSDGNSLLARSLWHGNRTLIESLDGREHTREDRLVIGDGAAFLVPLLRTQIPPCSELKNCSDRGCPAYGSAGVKCWIEAPLDCGGGLFGTIEEKRRACARCDVFSGCALLVVRGRPDSRVVSPETTGSIVTLANEASLALEVVTLYENTRKMSVTDGLTGLVNHREFYQSLRRELDRARRYHHTVSLLMIDLDDFKRYNDDHGHLAGDMALRKVAEILRDCVRATDIVARYGGEEFGVIIPETTPGGALMMAERIKTAIGTHDFRPGVPGGVRLTVSIGIYSSEGGLITEDQLVGFADEAAYHAKSSGKNRVVVKANA